MDLRLTAVESLKMWRERRPRRLTDCLGLVGLQLRINHHHTVSVAFSMRSHDALKSLITDGINALDCRFDCSAASALPTLQQNFRTSL